jgi:DNA-binding CsgD family transcriptional regulator
VAEGDPGDAAERASRALTPGSGAVHAGPFARAQLELAGARAWRRAGDHGTAARVLGNALGRFEALRAVPWVAAVEAELAALGRRRSPRRAPGGDLTAQERAVAHVVARGASNREAADELFISVKTVEHHLSRIYAKLGVRSRTELAGVILDTLTSP